MPRPPRPVVLEVAPSAPRVGQGNRRIDRPLQINPAVEYLTVRQRRRVRAALSVLEHVKRRATNRIEQGLPSDFAVLEYAALHELMVDGGILLDDGAPDEDVAEEGGGR